MTKSRCGGFKRSLSLKLYPTRRQIDYSLLMVMAATALTVSPMNASRIISICYSCRRKPHTSFILLISRFFRPPSHIIVKLYPNLKIATIRRPPARESSSNAIIKLEHEAWRVEMQRQAGEDPVCGRLICPSRC